jgi:uncharacterized sporulation protein YeaH/YhbH (DUF444 family)
MDDREPARVELENVAKMTQYSGYVEISSGLRGSQSETSKLFDAVAALGLPSGRCSIRDANDVAGAVRHFFTRESQQAAAALDLAP